MLSITNEVDPLIFCCVYFVYDTNYVFPTIPCLCIHCVNCYRQSLHTMRIHLLHRGIMESYTKWYNRGEPCVLNENIHDNEMLDSDHMDGIDALVFDQIRGEPRNANQDKEVHNFDKFEEDAKRELYPGCFDYIVLKFVIETLNVKVMPNLSSNKFLLKK